MVFKSWKRSQVVKLNSAHSRKAPKYLSEQNLSCNVIIISSLDYLLNYLVDVATYAYIILLISSPWLFHATKARTSITQLLGCPIGTGAVSLFLWNAYTQDRIAVTCLGQYFAWGEVCKDFRYLQVAQRLMLLCLVQVVCFLKHFSMQFNFIFFLYIMMIIIITTL